MQLRTDSYCFRAVAINRLSLWSVLLILITVILAPRFAKGQVETTIDPSAEQLLFIEKLYKEKEYQRTVSEILRIGFIYPQSSARNTLDLYLLKSFYRLGDHESLVTAANEILKKRASGMEISGTRQIGVLLSASHLKKGDEKKAESYWQKYDKVHESIIFPSSEKIEGLVDPERAAFYSGIIPGSGLVLSGQHGQAAVSFLLNLIFISGTYAAFVQEQYGVAGLLFFFEISWYFGGKKATAEAAREYNSRLIQQRQQVWIRSLLNRHDLYDLE